MASFNDPAFARQWQLQAEHGINIACLYEEYSGAGIMVGVVDTALDPANPELAAQLDREGAQAAQDQAEADDAVSTHGTSVACVLAGAANNGQAGVGAAYGVTLRSYSLDSRPYRTLAQETEMLRLQWQVDVSNNSWSRSGEHFRDDFGRADYAGAAQALADAAALGRGGLGTVVVRSAGNDGRAGDDVNTHNYSNNRYTVLLGATDQAGQVQAFSNPGAALLVVAPATATSWAAPLGSATAALMLEANPQLGYRDVQTILAMTARLTDAAGAGWFDNAAQGWNGGGLHASHRAGFGMIDARAAVRLAEAWQAQSTAANLLQASAASATPLELADQGSASASLTIDAALQVERAELWLDLEHAKIGELRIVLISPSGTESVLLDQLHNGDYGPASGRLRFTFGSTQFLQESARGDWVLRIDDLAGGHAGWLLGWSLTLLGSAETPDTQHVLTDEYAPLAAQDAARAVLADSAGQDTLNGAALSGDAWIDLGGGDSWIAGARLQLAAGTAIEHAIGGDGNDTLLGNDLANRLTGSRGDDRLLGGAGDDTLRGGAGQDRLEGGSGDDLYWIEDAGDLVLEQAGQGHDTVWASLDHGLADAVEDLVLLAGALRGTGNAGDNALAGNAAANLLEGLAGDDRLDGGEGADRMLGGSGDDSYVVDDAGDVVVELRYAGYDSVESSIDYAMPLSIEALLLTGWAAIGGTGNAGDNRIAGNAAGNTLRGEDGADLLLGGDGDDTLYGGPGRDVVEGGAGADWLSGGREADLMRGGAGDDIYMVENLADRVSEQPGSGHDAVRSYVDFSLPSEVEMLTLLPGEARAGTGNRLDNGLTGNAGDNLLRGQGGDDQLFGGAGDDRLEGGSGDDLLKGGQGADLMLGGGGDDRFIVDAAGDAVVEARYQGTDTVQAWIGFALPEWVEALELAGQAAIDGRGNGLANSLTGNVAANGLDGEAGADALRGQGGDDRLSGGAGKDLLSGGSGDDWLAGGTGDDLLFGGSGADRFAIAPGEGRDRIADFRAGQGDTLLLQGFGPALDSWEALVAMLRREGADLVLDLGQGSTLVLLHPGAAPLTPDQVFFG